MFSFFKRKKAPAEPTVDTGQGEKASDALPSLQPKAFIDEGGTVHAVDAEVPAGSPEVARAHIDAPEEAPATVDLKSFEEPEPKHLTPSEPNNDPEPEPAQKPVQDPALIFGQQAVPESPPSLALDPARSSLHAQAPPSDHEQVQPSSQEPIGQPAQEAAAATSGGWLSRLKKGLARTGQSISTLFVGVKVDENLFEELETALIMADAGMEATDKLLTALRSQVRKEKLTEGGQVKAALRDILTEHLTPLEKPFPLGKVTPLVVMIAGVNGAGKTTSIGKLAHTFQAQGAKVLLAAGDTFRAAAREQLMEWGSRNDVTVIAQDGGDPAAVAFDAVNAGRAREVGVVMVDTAGRLPTQLHLMEELKKIKRVIGKAEGSAPHEVLLVIDGNTGQNAIAQIRAFDAAIGLTGLIVTKLDGTAKGGTLAAVAAGSQGVRPVPVYWIGVGEGMNDLQPFVAREFATAVLGG